MHKFLLVDDSTGEVVERHIDYEQASVRREALQSMRGTRIVIRKIRPPDAPMPKPDVRVGSSVHRDRALAARTHFTPTDDRLPRLEASRDYPRDVLEQALGRLDERLESGPWNREGYWKVRRRYRATPRGDGGESMIECDSVELALVRILAQTYPYNQFSVTPAGHVFVGFQLGFHRESKRLYVTTLSPILDEAADLLLASSLGEGGRFYVHSMAIEQAHTRALLASLRLDR